VTWAAQTSYALDSGVVIRLLAAAVLGGLVGVEREVSEQPAGLRTHIAVALGASLFGVISTLGFLEYDQLRASSTVQVDVSRVAANVVVGIGFLGAGVIFRQGNTVRNLTTAASLWTVAAIGLACGVGDVTTAAIGTVVLLGSLVLLRPLRGFVRRHASPTSTTVRVALRPGATADAALGRFHDQRDDGLILSRFAVHREEGALVILSDVAGPPGALRRWMAELATAEDVEAVSED
jgi:putative Mg2+ transporter-C (MgtC) family protein